MLHGQHKQLDASAVMKQKRLKHSIQVDESCAQHKNYEIAGSSHVFDCWFKSCYHSVKKTKNTVHDYTTRQKNTNQH